MLSYWRKRRSATRTFNIVLLDGTSLTLQLESRCSGSDLVRRALETQRILSNQEIFGLTTATDNCRRWLNLTKSVKKQISGHSPYTVQLCVWAYPRDHHSLLQSFTRHQLYLQVKQDLLHGRLRAGNETSCATLAGLIVQREVGDFEQHMCGEGYIQELAILPTIGGSLEESVSGNHRTNRGLTGRECEERALTLAQGEFSYATHSYTVQDSLIKRSTLQLSICVVGVRVAESVNSIITYEWEVIERVGHKGKQLFLDLVSNSKMPPPNGPTLFTCPSIGLAASLSYWASFLREYYCHDNPLPTRSRLRRFFSSRRSMRRRPVVEPGRRMSAVIEERRSSFGNDNHHTTTTESSPSIQRSESKGLVVYGASGLASQNEPMTSNDLTTVATVNTDITIHIPQEENYVPELYSDNRHTKSHDRERISHDENPEIKSVSAAINHSHRRSHDSSRRSHDFGDISHDTSSRAHHKNMQPSPLSHDISCDGLAGTRSNRSSAKSRSTSHISQNGSYRSHDSPAKSHTKSQIISHDRPPRSHDSPRRSHDSPHRSHDSPHRSHDGPHRSHDSPHRSSKKSRNNYKHYELGPQQRSSREGSPITQNGRVRRSSTDHTPERASSLTRHLVPEYSVVEDKEWNGSDVGPRVIDPAAKPKNRIRLSLPEGAFYDSQPGRLRGGRLSMSSRRARNTSITSTTGSLSQPMEGTGSQWGLSYKLGSIASLETQASLAELSQADSFVDPHMRSFVFQASQPDTATEL